jgi:hypothetical protein
MPLSCIHIFVTTGYVPKAVLAPFSKLYIIPLLVDRIHLHAPTRARGWTVLVLFVLRTIPLFVLIAFVGRIYVYITTGYISRTFLVPTFKLGIVLPVLCTPWPLPLVPSLFLSHIYVEFSACCR